MTSSPIATPATSATAPVTTRTSTTCSTRFGRCRTDGLIVVNLVDFDSDYGHRRDVPGYAACLERFDARLPEVLAALRPGDLLVITADHGNDPTFRGTDHTREYVPVLAFGAGHGGPLGRRASFADVGATLAQHLGLAATPAGRSWL